MGFKLRVTTSSLLARPFCQFIEETDEDEVGAGFNQQRLTLSTMPRNIPNMSSDLKEERTNTENFCPDGI